MSTKVCTKCGEEKGVEEFNNLAAHKDGKSSCCKKCDRDYFKQYRVENKDGLTKRVKARQAGYTIDTEGTKRCSKCGVVKDVGEFCVHKRSKGGRDCRCKECKGKQDKEYSEKNKEKILSKAKEYKKAHRKRYNEWERNKKKTDPNYKLSSLVRSKVFKLLKGDNKQNSSLSFLGCSVEEARKHIEAQFRPGMSWENHGQYGWHIDHIRPLSSFDLADLEQAKIAFHYTNLQPLWAEENLTKGKKLYYAIA